MKTTALLSTIAMITLSCNNNTTVQKETTPEPNQEQIKPIGGYKDEHGCITAAGETWSQLRQTCLQIFNEGTRLNPTTITQGEAVISAFALYNEDKTKVEIFLPDNKQTIILDKSTDHMYINNEYEYNANLEILKINGKEVYKADKTVSQVLIIFYDTQIGNKNLMKAIEDYKATLVYSYTELKGVAISVPKDKTEEAIEYFKKVNGVLSVEIDQAQELHKNG